MFFEIIALLKIILARKHALLYLFGEAHWLYLLNLLDTLL
jgi:hypothetical protein